MQQELIWLSVSLFCNKNNWNKLMTDGINVFVSSTPNLISYTIEFNYLSGENIRLSLLVNKSDAQLMAKSADEYFKAYFASANLTVKQAEPPFMGVFMPFPANTIQYGLYTPQPINTDEVERYQTAINLSAIMLEALQDEIDDETIITFAFYLQMGLVRSLYNYLQGVDELFSITSELDVAYKAEGDLTSSYSLMDEITVDVMQSEKFDHELDWMNKWITQCKATLKVQTANSGKGIQAKQFYANRMAAISRQLGLNNNSKNLLSHFIDRSLRQYLL